MTGELADLWACHLGGGSLQRGQWPQAVGLALSWPSPPCPARSQSQCSPAQHVMRHSMHSMDESCGHNAFWAHGAVQEL